MQNRRMILALVAAIGVFYLWMAISLKFWPPEEPPAPPTPATAPATAPVTTRESDDVVRPVATQPPVLETLPATAPSATAPEEGARVSVKGDPQAESFVLGDARRNSPYPMELTIAPRGGAVEQATIRGHYMTVEREEPYAVLSPVEVGPLGNERKMRSFVTRKVRFENLDHEVDLSDVSWNVESTGPEEAVLSVRIAGPDDTPLAVIRKRYHLPPQPPGSMTSDMVVSVTIENLTDAPLNAILTQGGPIGLQRAASRSEDRRVSGAIWQDDTLAVEGYWRRQVAREGGMKLLGRDNEQEGVRVAWAGLSNQYFTCLMAPHDRFDAQAKPWVARCEARTATGPTDDRGDDLTIAYVSRPIWIEKGTSAEVAFDCYIGPKSKRAFEQVEAYAARGYYNVIREGFAWCAPAGLVGFMMTLLNTFHRIPPHNYGLAIIILVVIVRALLHPITKRSQVNMMKMQQQQASLQPKIKVIREKYANDRTKMNQAMMELYREEGINPAGQILSCLPMLLQFPIWIALWTALSSTIEMRHAPFDGWWIRDLAAPDAVYTFSHPVQIPILGGLMGGPIDSLNLLPILLGLSQLLQTKLMPRPSSPQPDGAPDQRKMMMFMSVFFVFILYNAPSGLNLYIMSSTLFGILEQHRIRKHIADYKANRQVEDARRKEAAGKREKGWFHRKWEELVKEADDARRITSSKKKQRP